MQGNFTSTINHDVTDRVVHEKMVNALQRDVKISDRSDGPHNTSAFSYIFTSCDKCGSTTMDRDRGYELQGGGRPEGSTLSSDVGVMKFPRAHQTCDDIKSTVQQQRKPAGRVVDPLGTTLTFVVSTANDKGEGTANITLLVRVGVFAFKKEIMAARMVDGFIDIKVASATSTKIRRGVNRADIRCEMEEAVTRITTGTQNWFDVAGASENIFIDMTHDAISAETIRTLIADGLKAADELHRAMIGM